MADPMHPFITGSRMYGIPREDSDVDLVVFMPDDPCLHSLCGQAEEVKEYAKTSASLRFGKLNIIAVRTEGQYQAWLAGTTECVVAAPVTREFAVEAMKRHGVV